MNSRDNTSAMEVELEPDWDNVTGKLQGRADEKSMVRNIPGNRLHYDVRPNLQVHGTAKIDGKMRHISLFTFTVEAASSPNLRFRPIKEMDLMLIFKSGSPGQKSDPDAAPKVLKVSPKTAATQLEVTYGRKNSERSSKTSGEVGGKVKPVEVKGKHEWGRKDAIEDLTIKCYTSVSGHPTDSDLYHSDNAAHIQAVGEYNYLDNKIETGVPPLMEIPVIVERNPSKPDSKFHCYVEMKCRGMGFWANMQRGLLPWKLTKAHPKEFDPPSYDKSSTGGIEETKLADYYYDKDHCFSKLTRLEMPSQIAGLGAQVPEKDTNASQAKGTDTNESARPNEADEDDEGHAKEEQADRDQGDQINSGDNDTNNETTQSGQPEADS
jgi:hypothetical protein